MSPRPILKRSSPETSIHRHQQHPQHPHQYQQPPPSTTRTHGHGVHFPPSPSQLTRTFHVDSAHVYDRSPIVVTPNSCALPARGCPGHTYFDDPSTMKMKSKRRDYHPRALAYDGGVPQLIPDLSSESEESDGPISLSSSSSTSSASSSPTSTSGVMFGPHGLPASIKAAQSMNTMHRYAPVDEEEATALAFLPYSPSCPFEETVEVNAQMEKHRRRRPSRERKHDGHGNAYRIPNGEGQGAQQSQLAFAFSNLNVSSSPAPTSTYSPPSPPRKRSSSRTGSSRRLQGHPSPSFGSNFGGLGDDGCLGGF